MSYLLRPRSFAAFTLALLGAGAIAVACSSDDRNPAVTPGEGPEPNTNTSANPNQPTMPGAGNPTTPGTGMNPPAPGNTTPGNQTPPGEGNPGNVPVVPPNEMMPGEMGNNPTPDPMMPAEPGARLAPNCNPPEGAVPNLSLELVANVTQPLHVQQAPGDDARLFILEKGGAVRVVANGQLQQAPFITQQVQNQGERGLLGLAFHPDFATNGLFYLHFSSAGGNGLPAAGTTVVAEYQAPGDRSVGDPATRRVVLTIADPEANHNGGEIVFGPDRMLYIGMGDGGGANDQHGAAGNGQNLNTLLGKMLRIDPTGRAVNNAYSVPAGNFAQVTGQQALPEIWASGLRNPWRLSFDACNGDLYIADVGQNTLEEVDFVAAGADRTIEAGANFGWRLMEGPNCRPADANCNAQTVQQLGLVQPVDSYERAIGQSITGGYVYRGSSVPGLRGTYIYADYASARFFRFRINNGAIADKVEITNQMRPAGGGNIDNIASFGTDNAGEMYVAAFTPGAVYKVIQAP